MKPQSKECIDCRHVLPLDDFYRQRAGEEKRQSRCKRCDNKVRAKNVRRGLRGPEFVRRPDGSLAIVRGGS